MKYLYVTLTYKKGLSVVKSGMIVEELNEVQDGFFAFLPLQVQLRQKVKLVNVEVAVSTVHDR